MTIQSGSDLDGRTIGEIAATLPGATAVFRKFKMDFCCHGDADVGDMARQCGVDTSDLAEALDALEKSKTPVPTTPETDELIDHILRYHETHRRELPQLITLARKVETVHAGHPQAPHGLADLLHQMRGELEVHMKKEELILFPAMRRGPRARFDAPIAQMRHDHDDHGEQMRRMETLTGDFTPPAGACRSWQALCTGAAKLAEDLMEHIHLENNILFPRYQGALAS